MNVYLFAVILIASNLEPTSGRKIVGGNFADIGSFPYQVSLDIYGTVCGGSIIARSWTLTAAHCVINLHASYVIVYAGSSTVHQGYRHSVEDIHVHNAYNHITLDFDVALLRMSTPFDFSVREIKPISLVRANGHPKHGDEFVVSGWGSMVEGGPTSQQLMYANVDYIKNGVCKPLMRRAREVLTARMMCAGVLEGGVDSCQGDSGGPLVSDRVQVGIVSWGVGCGRNGRPGVYTSLANANIRNWIKRTARV